MVVFFFRESCFGESCFISFSSQPPRKVCIANRNIGQFCLNNLLLYSALFRFGHIRRWDQCAAYILYSKISTDPGLLKIRQSHRFVAVAIQFLIPPLLVASNPNFSS